jgi:hypothetical protein
MMLKPGQALGYRRNGDVGQRWCGEGAAMMSLTNTVILTNTVMLAMRR